MAFEDNLRRLQAITDELGSNTLPLDSALTLFEEGIALLRDASAQLAAVEARVQQLVDEADGAVTLQDLDD